MRVFLWVAPVVAMLAAGPASGALPEGYLVWSKGTADDAGTRKIHRITLPQNTDDLTLTAGEDVEPQASPDGKWVAYAKAKFPGGSDYHDFKLWKVYVVSIHGVGQGRREIKIDDDGAWPSWSKSGALYYNQADGTHSRVVRVEIDDRGRITRRTTALVTRDLFGGYAEVNEVTVAPDESWFAARTRGNASQNGVSALTLNPPISVALAHAGSVGCMPRVAPSGSFAIIAGAEDGIRWGHGPRAGTRKEDQLLIPAQSAAHKAYHPGVSSDERWVMAAQGTDADHNSGRYDVRIYALDAARMTVSDEQPLLSGGFNGWPDLWVGRPAPPPPARPEVAEFYPSSYTVPPGDVVTLTWSTFGADEVSLDGRPVAVEATAEAMPAASTTYTLVARSKLVADSDSRAVAIQVNETPQAVVITRFTAAALQVEKGKSTTLAWQVQNATTLDLDAERAAPTDSREVSPLATTTYVLTAQGHGGPVRASVTVNVAALKDGLLPDHGGFRCTAAPAGGIAGAGRASLTLWLAALGLLVLLAGRMRRWNAARLPRPEVLQIDLHRIERLGTHLDRTCDAHDHSPGFSIKAKHLKCLGPGIEEPDVPNLSPRVVVHFPGSIHGRGGRRENLTQPIGGKFDERNIRDLRHALAPPAGDVGHEDLPHDVQLGLVQDHPAARLPAPLAPVGRAKVDSEPTADRRVSERRAGACDKLTVEDLRHLMIRHALQILVRSRTALRDGSHSKEDSTGSDPGGPSLGGSAGAGRSNQNSDDEIPTPNRMLWNPAGESPSTAPGRTASESVDHSIPRLGMTMNNGSRLAARAAPRSRSCVALPNTVSPADGTQGPARYPACTYAEALAARKSPTRFSQPP